VAHASQLVPIPESVSFEVAGSIPLAYATAHRMLVTRAAIRAGEKVLVLGASGGVGTACVLIAKLIGAEVIACASSADKLDRLAALGADHGVDYAKSDMREAVWELVGKPRVFGAGGVDVVVKLHGRRNLGRLDPLSQARRPARDVRRHCRLRGTDRRPLCLDLRALVARLERLAPRGHHDVARPQPPRAGSCR
jgi:NADPH:quinone reductase-like Zn-dependent oxidoreductase